MRIAIVSDIHGNGTAFEAVVRDLRATSPDLVLHGGDLADSGSSPVEIVDRIRELGWPGVMGNTDEMLFDPASLDGFASASAAPEGLWSAVREMAAWTREALGAERLGWLSSIPRTRKHGDVALVHATAETAWRAPFAGAGDEELLGAYAGQGGRVAVYGHIHTPFVRRLPGLIVANSGSAGLPHDGDARASYLLIDGADIAVRRVEYDVPKEADRVRRSGLPHAEWVATMLAAARPLMP